jgi:hypothetical protein
MLPFRPDGKLNVVKGVRRLALAVCGAYEVHASNDMSVLHSSTRPFNEAQRDIFDRVLSGLIVARRAPRLYAAAIDRDAHPTPRVDHPMGAGCALDSPVYWLVSTPTTNHIGDVGPPCSHDRAWRVRRARSQ